MYSSFKKHQLITESWRRFIQEVSEEERFSKIEELINIAESDVLTVQEAINQITPEISKILENIIEILDSKEYNFIYDFSKNNQENEDEKNIILSNRKEKIDNVNNLLSTIIPGVQIETAKLMNPSATSEQLNEFIYYLAEIDNNIRKYKKSGLKNLTQAERSAKLIKINKKLKSLETLFFNFEKGNTYQEKSQAIFDYYKNLKPNEIELTYLRNLFTEQNKIKLIYTQILTKLKLDINKSILNLLKNNINLNNLIYVTSGAIKRELTTSSKEPNLFQKFKKLLSPNQTRKDIEDKKIINNLITRINQVTNIWAEVNNFDLITNLMTKINSLTPSMVADFKKFQLVPGAIKYKVRIPRTNKVKI
jgi:hypothetical protein